MALVKSAITVFQCTDLIKFIASFLNTWDQVSLLCIVARYTHFKKPMVQPDEGELRRFLFAAKRARAKRLPVYLMLTSSTFQQPVSTLSCRYAADAAFAVLRQKDSHGTMFLGFC